MLTLLLWFFYHTISFDNTWLPSKYPESPINKNLCIGFLGWLLINSIEEQILDPGQMPEIGIESHSFEEGPHRDLLIVGQGQGQGVRADCL